MWMRKSYVYGNPLVMVFGQIWTCEGIYTSRGACPTNDWCWWTVALFVHPSAGHYRCIFHSSSGLFRGLARLSLVSHSSDQCDDTSFPSYPISSSSKPSLLFPGITSQINYLHTSACFQSASRGTENVMILLDGCEPKQSKYAVAFRFYLLRIIFWLYLKKTVKMDLEGNLHQSIECF